MGEIGKHKGWLLENSFQTQHNTSMAEAMYPVGYISHVVAIEYDWIIAN